PGNLLGNVRQVRGTRERENAERALQDSELTDPNIVPNRLAARALAGPPLPGRRSAPPRPGVHARESCTGHKSVYRCVVAMLRWPITSFRFASGSSSSTSRDAAV